MTRFLVQRLIAVPPLLLVITMIVFGLLAAVPGDAAVTIAGENASPELVEQTRRELGLDRSLITQYGDWVSDAVTGDLGQSLTTQQSVMGAIAQRAPATLSLAGLSLLIAIVLALAAGTVAALRPNGWVDHGVSIFAGLALALPPFVVGILLVALFAISWRWLPALGYVSLTDDPVEWLRHLVLPALAIAARPAAELMRHTRGSMVDALSQDYVRTARARGLGQRSIVGKHAAKNAAVPIVTILGVLAQRIINGVVTIEFVFALPGIGSLAFHAVQTRDIPLIQGIVLLTALVTVLMNLAVDASYQVLDPRSRTT